MNDNGSSNLDIVYKVIDEISNSKSLKNQILIIKSTISPGTTEMLMIRYKNLEIIFNPEFLTEANFVEDFKNQK